MFFLRVFLSVGLVPLFVLAEPAKPPVKPHFVEQMVPFILIFLLFYFLLIRPAHKRQKKHQDLLGQLKKGDQVITTGGILGIIYGLTESFVTLDLADNVRIRVLRSHISSLADKNKDPSTPSNKLENKLKGGTK